MRSLIALASWLTLTLARSYGDIYGQASSSLSTCETSFFDVEGGTAPYSVSIITDDGRTLVRWPNVEAAGLLSWRTNAEPNTVVRLLVRDAQGIYFESNEMVVHEGLSTACLPGGTQADGSEQEIVARQDDSVRRVVLKRDGLAPRGTVITVTRTATATGASGACGYNCVTTQYVNPTTSFFIPTTYIAPTTYNTCPTVTVSVCPTYQTSGFSYSPQSGISSFAPFSTVSQSPVYTTYTLPSANSQASSLWHASFGGALVVGVVTVVAGAMLL